MLGVCVSIRVGASVLGTSDGATVGMAVARAKTPLLLTTKSESKMRGSPNVEEDNPCELTMKSRTTVLAISCASALPLTSLPNKIIFPSNA